MASTFRRRGDALWRRVADGVVVLGVHAEGAVELKGPAVDLWGLLAVDVELDDVVEQLSRAYRADPAVVRDDLTEVLDQLVRQGAVEVVP